MTQNLERFDQQARVLEARLHIEALRENELSQLPRTLEAIRNQMWNAQTELPSVDISRLWLAVESRVTTGDQAGELRREATQQLRENARPVFSGVAAAGVLVSNAPGGELETPVDFAAEIGGNASVVAAQQIEPDSTRREHAPSPRSPHRSPT